MDGKQIGTSVTAPPYAVSLNTTQLSNGQHTLTAVATDGVAGATWSRCGEHDRSCTHDGQHTLTAAVATDLARAAAGFGHGDGEQLTPALTPTVVITSPAAGATVSGTMIG